MFRKVIESKRKRKVDRFVALGLLFHHGIDAASSVLIIILYSMVSSVSLNRAGDCQIREQSDNV
jgi:hypothetical protein